MIIVRLYKLVEVHEVQMVAHLVTSGVDTVAGYLATFKLNPAFLLLVVLECRTNLYHLLQCEDDLGREPASDTALKAVTKKKKCQYYSH